MHESVNLFWSNPGKVGKKLTLKYYSTLLYGTSKDFMKTMSFEAPQNLTNIDFGVNFYLHCKELISYLQHSCGPY